MDENTEKEKKGLTARQRKFLKILSNVAGNVSVACAQCGKMSRNTFYYWCHNNEEFNKAVEEINDETIDYAESKLMNLIKNENPTAIIFYLKTKGKKRGYIETIENQITSNAFEDLMKSLPDEEE